MCVLTHDVILAELKSGRLRIDPLELDQVGPASIDLHLGAELRVPSQYIPACYQSPTSGDVRSQEH